MDPVTRGIDIIVNYLGIQFDVSTPQPLYNMVHYNTVLNITRIIAGPHMVIND